MVLCFFPGVSIEEYVILLRLNYDCLQWGILSKYLVHCVFHTG